MSDRTLIRNPDLAAAYAAILNASTQIVTIGKIPADIDALVCNAVIKLYDIRDAIQAADAQIQKAKEGEG